MKKIWNSLAIALGIWLSCSQVAAQTPQLKEQLEKNTSEEQPEEKQEKKVISPEELARYLTILEADQLYQAGDRARAARLYRRVKLPFELEAEAETLPTPVYDISELQPGAAVYWEMYRAGVEAEKKLVVENLNVRSMVKNHKLAKAISDAGWGQFCTMLKYKAEWSGKIYIEVDRFFPSSKTCNNCLNVVESLPLEIREWECPQCQVKHDRDVNAACNIRDEGLRILAVGRIATASGARVRPAKGTAFRGHLAKKEESPAKSRQ